MNWTIFIGIMIPFVGTLLGSACVFFMKKQLSVLMERILIGFASGVMVAASIWSLIIPAIEQSEHMGKLSVLPAFVGFWLGIGFLAFLDKTIPHIHVNSDEAEGPKSNLSSSTMMMLAVTMHNVPEGMAVGAVYAALSSSSVGISASAALALALGIAIQNFPEGAIISMPLHAKGESRSKAFLLGTLSGIVEPIASFLTISALNLIVPVMPYLLSFAAGAMMYVVIEELIPEMSQGEHSHAGVYMFSLGFTLMMVLDVVLG